MGSAVARRDLEDISMKKDSSGHTYIDFNEVRLTYIPAKYRGTKKNWAGQDVVAVRAYKAEDKGLHMGAEIPIGDGRGVVGLIAAICTLVSHSGELPFPRVTTSSPPCSGPCRASSRRAP